jgi:hypothetical protein
MYRRASLAAACTAALALTALGSSPASAISTYSQWNGIQDIESFGCPNTTTYGQVITVKNKTMLNKFGFSWKYVGESGGSMVVRGEVYAWDGTKATGSALWESDTRKISFTDGVFHKEVFSPGALPLISGERYVLFASIDKDFAKCKNGYIVGWGAVADSAYANGTFVYQNNGGNSANWTQSAWSGFGIDLAFDAKLQ